MADRKLILSMQMTLDGFVAGPNDSMDWMQNSEEEWKEMLSELQDADTFLLGRKMYPGYSQYWQSVLKNPAGDKNEFAFAKLAEKTQHIVFTTRDFQPDWNNTRVAHNLEREITSLKKQPGKNIIAWGGANFGSNLINSGMLDEIRLVINPVILGKGKWLFDSVDNRSGLELIESKQMRKGILLVRYKVKQ